MANIDAFSAQIIKLVREMPDEAILDLVKNQLGALGVSAPKTNGRRGGKAGRASTADGARGRKGTGGAKRRPGRPRTNVLQSEERRATLDKVEQLVKASAGVSASDVAKGAVIPQTRAAAALKELKLAKRIFQGGDRRFARYAGDAKTAELASVTARKSATGPTPGNGKKLGRGRKAAAAK